MIEFAGWEMPVHYGSQLAEHMQVRRNVGVFDIGHMTVVDVRGPDATSYLQRLLANDVGRLIEIGQALYSCMLNDNAGVLDDVIVYRMGEAHYRLVFNAVTHDRVVHWTALQAEAFAVRIEERRDLAILAVQGPCSPQIMRKALPPPLALESSKLSSFRASRWQEWVVGRTGYTGEVGYELYLPCDRAEGFWQTLLDLGAPPCGLGARDSLRLEAGFNLYGAEMDESTSPLECGLGWTVAWQPESRNFNGREALQQLRARGVRQKRVGIVLQAKGVVRATQRIRVGDVIVGRVTSGGFSPLLGQSIALARVAPDVVQQCEVEIRGRWRPAAVVVPPFVRFGRLRLKPSRWL